MFTAFRTVLNSLPITGPLLAPFEFAATMRTDFWREAVLGFRFHPENCRVGLKN